MSNALNSGKIRYRADIGRWLCASTSRAARLPIPALTKGQPAIAHIFNSNGDELLLLETGSQIYAAHVFDLKNVVPGDKLVEFDQPNSLLTEVKPAGIVQPAQIDDSPFCKLDPQIACSGAERCKHPEQNAVETLGYNAAFLERKVNLSFRCRHG